MTLECTHLPERIASVKNKSSRPLLPDFQRRTMLGHKIEGRWAGGLGMSRRPPLYSSNLIYILDSKDHFVSGKIVSIPEMGRGFYSFIDGPG